MDTLMTKAVCVPGRKLEDVEEHKAENVNHPISKK